MLDQKLIGLTTVADIQPRSRYAPALGDAAQITTSLLFDGVVTVAELLTVFTDAQVTVDPGGTLATIVQSVSILPQPQADSFSLSLYSPPPDIELIKNGDVSVTYLLPRSAVYPSGPVYEVDLVSATADGVTPAVFGVGAAGLPAVGGRIAVAFWMRQDPGSVVEWAYKQIRDRLP